MTEYSENGSGYPRFWNSFWNYRTGSLEPFPTSNHYSHTFVGEWWPCGSDVENDVISVFTL